MQNMSIGTKKKNCEFCLSAEGKKIAKFVDRLRGGDVLFIDWPQGEKTRNLSIGHEGGKKGKIR